MKGWGNYSSNESAARLLGWPVLAISIISHPAPAELADSEQKKILILGHARKVSPFQNHVGKKRVTLSPEVSVYFGQEQSTECERVDLRARAVDREKD
jgi:hypothetical protein